MNTSLVAVAHRRGARSLGPAVSMLCILVALATARSAAADMLPSDVPESIRAPAGEKVILKAHATGSQVYVCAQSAEGALQWSLKAPDARLHDAKGKVVGTHFAGPTWKYRDGSEVTGKAVGHTDSPDPEAIPWLLVSATGHKGTGLFTKVSSIQRIHTMGGKPPAAAQCTAEKRDQEVRSQYAADYYFYAPAS